MIKIVDASHTFKNQKQHVLKDINLTIKKGEFFVLVGHSGSGKTTLLKTINRLIDLKFGAITVDNVDIKEINMKKLRDNIGFVIQQNGLFPHLNVFDNISLVAQVDRKISEDTMNQRVEELLELVGLDQSYSDRYPQELSGGQMQRIGIARALMNNPEIILMDEPFSALDPINRELLQREIKKIQQKIGTTIVFVTHDIDEALSLADRICYMKDGKIIQIGTPYEFINNPMNNDVKLFIGEDRVKHRPEFMNISDVMSVAKQYEHYIYHDEMVGEVLSFITNKSSNQLVVVNRETGIVEGLVSLSELFICKSDTQVVKCVDKEVARIEVEMNVSHFIQQYTHTQHTIFPTVKKSVFAGIVEISKLLHIVSGTHVGGYL